MPRHSSPNPTPSPQDSAHIASHSNPKAGWTKLLLISVVGVGFALLSTSKLVASSLADKTDNESFKSQVLVGSVKKKLQQFSFVTEQGVQYHIADPSNILDDLAKKRGITDPFYQLNRVRVKVLISKVGNYGHMGYYERQITILGLDQN